MTKPERPSFASPYLLVQNVDDALRFYNAAFGFEVGQRMKDATGTIIHAEVFYRDQSIMLGAKDAKSPGPQPPNTSGHACPISLYLYCDDVDACYKNALAQGAESIQAPENQYYGDRNCAVKDIDGYCWYFATAL